MSDIQDEARLHRSSTFRTVGRAIACHMVLREKCVFGLTVEFSYRRIE